MSKDMCQRCKVKEATVTSEAGRFCSDCDELNDIEQDSASLQEENTQLRQLVQRAHTLLDDIRQPFKNVELYDVKKWLEDAQSFNAHEQPAPESKCVECGSPFVVSTPDGPKCRSCADGL